MSRDFKERFNEWFNKVELMGVKAANKFHRAFINGMMLFMLWNLYTFGRNYNEYWRLRRDPNIPRQWLEEKQKPGSDDWKLERERIDRDERMSATPQKKRGFYD